MRSLFAAILVFFVVGATALPSVAQNGAVGTTSGRATAKDPNRDLYGQTTGRGDTTWIADGGRPALGLLAMRRIPAEDPIWAAALRIHYDAIVIDGHVDTATLMTDAGYDVAARHRSFEAHVDIPRMGEGGLDAAFFSIWVPTSFGETRGAYERARLMIDEVKRQVRNHPGAAALARTADDVIEISRSGRRAVLMGLESAHALAGRDDLADSLYDAGIRYVTLTHTRGNSYADASQYPPRWNGLSARGRALVRRLNGLGMIMDLSHVSDATARDVIELSTAPVILSHSSARALTDNVRNADDDLLRSVASTGGVVMVNFYEPLVNRRLDAAVMDRVYETLGGRSSDLRNQWETIASVREMNGIPPASLDDVVAHIDHVARVAGVEHVGLGSDFDGARMPAGLDDVTALPWITHALLEKGYDEAAVRGILGGNILRVLADVNRLRDRAR